MKENQKEKQMFKEVKIKKFNPIYVIGLAWLVYGLIFPLYRIPDFFIAAAFSVICYFLAKRLIPEKTVLHPLTDSGTMDTRAMEIIDQGYDYIEQLEHALERITGKQLTGLILATQVQEITDISRQMLDYTVKNPRTALDLRNFIDYYFPTTIKLLDTYWEMQGQNVKSDNITAIMEKVHNVMDTIVEAFRKQLDSMFAEKKLDIKTDIEVLKSVLASEGLADKNSLNFKGGAPK
jgi:5-bromo-4-chloroindolyl phosphate hydrolysis protein